MNRARLALAGLLAICLIAAPAAEAAPKRGKLGARTLKTGAKGKDVRQLHRALLRLGVKAPKHARFTRGTARAVKKLERRLRWPVNGIVARKDAKRIRKLLRARPDLYYYFGGRYPLVTVQARAPGDARLKVVDAQSGLVVRAFALNFSSPGRRDVAWNQVASTGSLAPEATYQFRIEAGTARAAIVAGQTAPFLQRAHAFPVIGKHSYGGAGSRFGAPRSGHIHQGQDVSARCGQRLVAAQGGTVRVRSYQGSGAGHYVVIRGAVTGTDYVYMHLRKPSWAPPGTTVYTGQGIGKVGNTGASSGCHLHFERWGAPGWYQGGSPYDPLPELTYWDAYS